MPGSRPWSAGIAAAALGLVTLVAPAAMTFLAARADAYIYWADSQDRRIARAANDGTAVDGSFIPTTGLIPFAVAVDAAHVYWANMESNSIGRANIDGSGAENDFITGVTEPTGLAVNGSSIFWSSKHRSDRPGEHQRHGQEHQLHPGSGPVLRGRARRRPRVLGRHRDGDPCLHRPRRP